MLSIILLQQTTDEVIPFWVTLLREFGISTAIVVSALWFVYRYMAPAVIEYWKKEQEDQRKREDEQRHFLLGEIKRLQDESREDKKVILTALQQSSETAKQSNETAVKVQGAIEAITKEIIDMRRDTDARLESVQRDVSEIYRIVGRDRQLLQRDTPQSDR